MATVVTTLRIDETLHARLTATAAAEDRTTTAVIRRALTAYIEQAGVETKAPAAKPARKRA